MSKKRSKKCKKGAKKVSLTYKFIDYTVRKKDLKHIYDMPEDKFIEFLKTHERPSDLPEFVYKRVHTEKILIDGRPMFRLRSEKGTNGRAVLFIHGGGGMFAPTQFHYSLAVKLAEKTRAEVFFPFYPLAPEANADMSAEWIFKAYDTVTREYDPKTLTVIGDSAGALLAARAVSETKNKPHGVVLISPVTGTDKKDDKAMAARRGDILLSETVIEMVGKHWGRGIPLASPRMNAEYIDYTDFPPTLLYYGTNEMFAPHMDRLIENIKLGAEYLEVHKGEGMCHDWAILTFIPEGRAALGRICGFVIG